MDLRVGGKFKLIKKCGSGAFGEIYQGKFKKHKCLWWRRATAHTILKQLKRLGGIPGTCCGNNGYDVEKT